MQTGCFHDVRAYGAVGDGRALDTVAAPKELTAENLAGWWPEYFRMGGPLPAHGLYARHVRGLTLHDVEFKTQVPDARPAVAYDDVR